MDISTEQENLKICLSENTQMLRGKLGTSQSKLASIISVSRQTVNAAENGRMTWNLFISLILFFSHNNDTKKLLPVVKIDMEKIEEYLLNKEE